MPATPTPPPHAPRGLLTYKQAAKIVAASERSIFAWAKEGKIAVVRLGPKMVRIHPDEVDRICREGIAS